ncbi:MAG TPA: hypothetical protein VJY54_03830 [Lachnospiraceae bacterium]|nr:hypothetical protein [Lachnospiraceae bacterium]
MVFALPISVDAASDSKSGQISGVNVTAISNIDNFSGNSSTSASGGAVVSVSATYSYININTLNVYSNSGGDGDVNSASVSFSAPISCRSIRLVANHSVTLYGQNWSTSTSVVN